MAKHVGWVTYFDQRQPLGRSRPTGPFAVLGRDNLLELGYAQPLLPHQQQRADDGEQPQDAGRRVELVVRSPFGAGCQ